MHINETIAKELGVRVSQVNAAVDLLDQGNTIPFIARYRKEATGGLDDDALRNLGERLTALRALEAKKEEVRRLIEAQGNLTDEISEAIDKALTVTEVDDIYRPFRPKRKTRASIAMERGLEPLSMVMLLQNPKTDIEKEAEAFITEDVPTVQDALQGAMDIIAQQVSDDAEHRKWIRESTMEKGWITASAKTEEDTVYRMYYDFSENLKTLPSHRILAINRGENEEILAVKILTEKPADDSGAPQKENRAVTYLKKRLCKDPAAPSTKYVAEALEDAWTRLLYPSLTTEIRNLLTEKAEEQAIHVFGENLKGCLLTPPIKGKVVMGFDPAYRTGCKIAVVDDAGNLLATTVVYPTPPQNKKEEAEKILTALISRCQVDLISIGNGTASKESEIFVAGLIKKLPRPVSYIMTNEAGASVYSASKLGAQEFPELDVSLRSAVSIARRVQDPMAELVKIEPKSIGVGQYQHDMNPKRLSESLDGVVESCVSSVGADLNTASPSLLARIAGINQTTAKNICEYRKENRFKKRSELKKVKGIGDKAYIQCAGFLRVPESAEILDNTSVHPESYDAAKGLLKLTGLTAQDVKDHKVGKLPEIIESLGWQKTADNLGIGLPTLKDMVNELLKPGRDPRSELAAPILRDDIMDMNSLKPGMELTGTVRNVADFGAFVDIGVHQDGLVHISKLSSRFVRRAMDVVSVGDIIQVRVLEVDTAKKRISLERIE